MINKWEMGEPVLVVRDIGYSKAKLLSPQYMQKVKKRINDPTIPTGKYKLKELFAERGIIVNPKAMTFLYVNNLH